MRLVIIIKPIKMDEKNRVDYYKKIGAYVISIILIIGIALALRTYVFARVTVNGPSMQETLYNNDSLFVEKISTEMHNVKRGEIVVFDPKVPNEGYFIKRVIGIEGDVIEIKGGHVYLNNNLLKENYLSKGVVTEPIATTTKYVVPKNHVFVLGDNRTNSTDSRMLGSIDIKNLKGHVIVRIYPFNRMKLF
ncbi:signal peptidase I [Clostridium sp. WILCCON 0269]|uniref:Signal peptidase I n=1 Tax=Candidatus Clostridium eludens TaxID=3381663 RepID=A0ABW8SQL3_9CLOT